MFKDDHHNNNGDRSKVGIVAVVLAAVIFLGVSMPILAFAQTNAESKIIETQDVAVANLSDNDKQVNGLTFTPRWGAVSTLGANSVDVLFADCLEDEMAVSGMFIFQDTEDIVASQSFAVGTSDNVMWVTVVRNTGSESQAVGIGVMCVGDSGRGSSNTDFSTQTRSTIDNTVKKFIRLDGDQITNINNIINIRQQIIQNAIQVVKITGNNNTVSQVITQAANQIASVAGNTTTGPSTTQIQQAIDQSARQQGVIQGGGSLSQLIEQDASQQANVTGGTRGGGATSIDQGIDQGAAQNANVTRGAGGAATADTNIEQEIDQDAAQQAQVQQQPPPTTTTPPAGTPPPAPDTSDVDVRQEIEQQAEQQADIVEEEEETEEEEGESEEE